MKRVLGEILGLITGIAGVLFLIGWTTSRHSMAWFW